jgi:hypothetical protein
MNIIAKYWHKKINAGVKTKYGCCCDTNIFEQTVTG